MDRGTTDIVTSHMSGVIGSALSQTQNRVSLHAGEWLFHEGDPADCAYYVHAGRLEVVVELPHEVVLRQVKRGEMIGELALLMGGVRTASVRASRNSELTWLNRAEFEALLAGSPGFTLRLLQTMATQIAGNRSPSARPMRAGTVAVVGLDPAAPGAAIAAELAAALGRHRTTVQLAPEAGRSQSDIRRLLTRSEENNQLVVLAADSEPGAEWTDFCVEEADVVVAVTTGRPSPSWLARAKILRDCELVVLDAPLDPGVTEALAPREVQVARGPDALSAALTVTARRLAGKAVGLVLSGGGARALAHIGVLAELERSGFVIDRYAGASMGAIVSGLAATGAGSAEIVELCGRLLLEHNPSNDYTFPSYSLIRGVRTRRALEEVFAGRRIEELPRRWFCVASDLVRRELIVHKTGPVADAVFSSMALPGVYPPIPTSDGRLLVDGGVIDNLPIETMAQRREGPIIAVDVSQRLGMRPPARRPGLERLQRRYRRLLTGHEQPLPALRETIHWTIAVGSTDTVAAAVKHADLVISPQVEGIAILDWKQLPRALEIGRQAAREALAQAGPLVESWRL